MPKNVSCNAFYVFMLETKKRLEARGQTFRNMEEVVNIAAEPWDRMTQEQKDVYKEKAKEFKKSDEFSAYKKQVRGRLPKKMREVGPSRRRVDRPVEEEEFVEPVPYLYPSDDEEALEEFRKKHVRDRMEILDSWKWNLADKPNGILDLKCYVVSFISHCRTSAYAYFPAEIAVVEFSLRDGLKNSFCRILGPHALPPAAVAAATQESESHKIPFDVPTDGMTNDYVRIMDELLRFCRPSKNLRRLFCISKEFNCVQGCVKFLQTEAKQIEIRADRINCVDDLFQLFCEWRDKVCAPGEWRTFNDCDGTSPSAPFFQNPGLLCEFHSARGVHRCALATAKRAVYYLLQRIQAHYPVELTDNHRPPPMPPGGVTDTHAAAASWQMARAAVQQAQYYTSSHRDADNQSVASGTTIGTRRTTVYGNPDSSDIGMPRTLPIQLRRIAGRADAPDSWQHGNASAAAPEVQEDHNRRERPPSVNTAASVVDSACESTMETAPSVDWNQNKNVRDLFYKERSAKKRGQAVDAQQMNQDFARPQENQENVRDGVFSAAANATGFRPRAPISGGRFPTGGDITAGVVSSIASEFGSLRCTPASIVFPPPQNIPAAGPQNGTSGPRQRGFMAPRIAMPPNMGNSGPRPPFGRGQAVPSQMSMPMARPAGPPVRTQSHVKQMLTDRLRQQGEPSSEQ